MNHDPKRHPPAARLALAVVAALAALAVIATVALAVLFPPAKLEALVREQLRRSLRREVRFEKVSLGLWPPVRLAVAKPALAEPGGFVNGEAFAAGAVQLDLDVFALLSRRVRVTRLEIDEPALHLLVRADGSSNFDSLAAAPGAGGGEAPAMDLEVRAFVVRDGRVLLDDARSGRRVAFGLATTTRLAAEQGGRRIATSGVTEVSGLAFGPSSAAGLAGLDGSLGKLVWRIEHAGKYDAPSNRLALESLALAFGRTRLALSGLVEDLGPHARFDLRARGENLDIAELLAWAAKADAPALAGIAGAGALSFDLALRGAAPAPGAVAAIPAVTGTLALRGASCRWAGAPAGVTDLALDARFAPDSVTLAPVSARVAGQPVAASLAAWRFADPLVDFTVRGDVDLAAVSPLLAQAGAAPGAKLAGRAALDVRGSGRVRDAAAMALTGRAELRGVSVAAPGLPRPVEGIAGVVQFSPQRAGVRALTARAGRSSWTLDATVTRPLALVAKPGRVPPAGVAFDFRSPHLDLAELLPTTPGAPFLPNAQGAGKVAIAELVQGRLAARDVSAQVQLAPGALDATSFALAAYGGTLAGRARFDLSDTRRPVYAIQAHVKGAQANDLLSAWTPAKDLLRGTLDTDLDLSGAGQSPDDVKRTLSLTALASLAEGRLGPGPALEAVAQWIRVPQLRQVAFRDLRLPLRVVQGRVVTDGVTFGGPSGDWKLSGAVGFDGALDYAVSVTLPPDAVAALGARPALAAGALADDKGRVLLDLRVTGSAKAPRVAWDTAAMRDRLAGRASQALAGQRAKLAAQAQEAAASALARRLGLAADSTRRVDAARALAAARDSLRRSAGGLLRSFFGRGRAPADTAAR